LKLPPGATDAGDFGLLTTFQAKVNMQIGGWIFQGSARHEDAIDGGLQEYCPRAIRGEVGPARQICSSEGAAGGEHPGSAELGPSDASLGSSSNRNPPDAGGRLAFGSGNLPSH